MDKEQMRALLVKRKAREFAQMVKAENMAFKLPDELIDWLRDDELAPFQEWLKAFGLQKRADYRWEKA